MVKNMEIAHCDEDSFREEEGDAKSKKKKKDFKKAFRNLKLKMSSKRKGKNEVQEISIKPAGTQEAWVSDVTGRSSQSSRSSSAQSKVSKTPEVEDDDDGIEVIYDAAYQGGECE